MTSIRKQSVEFVFVEIELESELYECANRKMAFVIQ